MPRTYYAASYWYRYCEPSGVYVGLNRDSVERCVLEAVEEEEERSRDCALLGLDVHEEDCVFCNPDIVWNGVSRASASLLFWSAKELNEHRRELMRGEVIYLERG